MSVKASRNLQSREASLQTPAAFLSVLLQDSQTKIRIHGSRKKGVIIQSDVVASNGMIHIINKLMDSVPPTVESDTQVKTQRGLHVKELTHSFVSLRERLHVSCRRT